MLCTTCDSKTTAPIILAPGDVYVNADFGYQPDTGYGATIGDTIWLDANANGSMNEGEPGIAGRERRTDPGHERQRRLGCGRADHRHGRDGLQRGTTRSPACRSRTGRARMTTWCWVSDTNNVLGGPVADVRQQRRRDAEHQRGDRPGRRRQRRAGLRLCAVGQKPGEGLIGDTIFLDRDGRTD